MMSWLLVVLACSSQDAPPASPGAVPNSDGVSSGEPESNAEPGSNSDIDALRALGYMDYADEDTVVPDGLTEMDGERSFPGVTVLASRPNRTADLVSHTGEIIHTWSSRDTVGRWVRARLLEDGGLLVVGKGEEGPEESRYLVQLDANSEEIWRRPLAVHHEVATGPDGGWLTLELSYRNIEEIHPDIPVRDDRILFLDSEGERVRSFSLYDSLTQSGVEISPVQAYEGDSGMMVDLFHSNSLFWMDTVIPRFESPSSNSVYAPGGVLICIRHQNRVAVLDSETGLVRWTWGTEFLSGPHDATLLDSGNILVFDNGLGHGRSRILEVDPRTNEIVWRYEASNPTEFYSASRGSAQRLPNGNTLIAESDEGHAFEVTPDGEIVWDYYSTRRSARDGGRATIIRAIRYPESWAPD